MKNTLTRAVIYVLGGAISYGVLATFVKLAYDGGYKLVEVTMAQYAIGLLYFIVAALISKIKYKRNPVSLGRPALWLMAGGTTFGLTGYFYYLALQYIPASIAVVLLMQTVWMGVIAQSIRQRKMPSPLHGAAVIVAIAGTVLATNAITQLDQLDIRGLLWGLASAVVYTIALYTSEVTAPGIDDTGKSLCMLIGATTALALVNVRAFDTTFNFSIFWTWGLLLGVFGTIIPPLFLNKGLPVTGLGMGSVLISIEIPVSILMAVTFLPEKVSPLQWVGVGCILCAILLINYKRLSAKSEPAAP